MENAMKNQKNVLSTVLFACICAGSMLTTHSGFARSTDSADSPFGFHPAAVIPPFEYGLDNPYSFAVDIGVKWERPLNFIWTRMQPELSRDFYIWINERQFQDSPASMHKMGNIVIGNPDFDPLYTRYARDKRSFLPRDEQAYKKFVRALVERYDGDGIGDMPGLRAPITHWQVDNEPPHGLDDYPAFLKMTYGAVKEANPEAMVLIGGIPGFPPVSSYIANFNKYYLPILDELSKYDKTCFDIFDFHWFGNASGDYLGVREVFEYVQKVLKERNLTPAHGFWITEMGTYSGDPVPIRMMSSVDFPLQSELDQAVDVVKKNIYPLSLGIKKVFMAFGLTEGFRKDQGYFDFTGFIYDGKYAHDLGKGVKKLSYYTYKKMTEILEGSDWQAMETIREKDRIHIYRVENRGKSIWIAWNDNSDEQEVRLPLNKKTRQVILTEAVPDQAAGRDVKDYDTAFRVRKGKISSGNPPQLQFKLGRIPVFIQEQ
jgi:hypothetical protein